MQSPALWSHHACTSSGALTLLPLPKVLAFPKAEEPPKVTHPHVSAAAVYFHNIQRFPLLYDLVLPPQFNTLDVLGPDPAVLNAGETPVTV